MKSFTFVIITLSSGVIAGIILAFLNLGIVEPTIDKAIALEVQKQVSSGENVNMSELIDYRYWQKGGAFAGGAIYGVGLASLFGVVFVFARNKLPGKNNKQKAIVLAGIMWFVLFLMVALNICQSPSGRRSGDDLLSRDFVCRLHHDIRFWGIRYSCYLD